MNNLVAITQPDFFPWLGSIEKIILADTFVFLDHVTNRPGDGLWTKRVKFLINQKPQWLTIPLKSDPEREFVPINEMHISYDSDFTQKHIASLTQNYKKAPYYEEVFPLIESCYESKFTKIVEFNLYFIQQLIHKAGINKHYHYSSQMQSQSKSNLLLIDLVKEVNGDAYLFGSGSINYLDPPLWKDAQIKLVPQNYVHPTYNQFNSKEFFPGLSIVDCLMNIGIGATFKFMRTKNHL